MDQPDQVEQVVDYTVQLDQVLQHFADSVQWSHNIYDAVSLFGSLLLGLLLGFICAKGMFDAWS